jgi:flagellar assembly protein FliH
MVEQARGPSASGKRQAIVSDGTYRIERGARFLRPPSGVKLAPAAEVRISASELEQAETERLLEMGPTPEEIARQEAEKILADARQEAEELKRQGREQGYTDGLKEGMEQGKTQGREEALGELKDTLDRWLTMGDALTEAWRMRFDGLEDEIKDLAIAAAEKLVQAHLAAAPDTVLSVVKDAMRHAAEAERVSVLISPADLATVRAAKDELTGMLKGTGRFEIVEAENVEPGSCMVETKTQVIDATRKSRVDSLKDSMDGGKSGPTAR